MKATALALAIFATASALAGPCPKNTPRIVGMDYHHARAELILAGFVPVRQVHDPNGAPFEFTRSDALGYIETAGFCYTGSGCGSFIWQSAAGQPFEVYATGCEFLEPGAACKVERVICH